MLIRVKTTLAISIFLLCVVLLSGCAQSIGAVSNEMDSMVPSVASSSSSSLQVESEREEKGNRIEYANLTADEAKIKELLVGFSELGEIFSFSTTLQNFSTVRLVVQQCIDGEISTTTILSEPYEVTEGLIFVSLNRDGSLQVSLSKRAEDYRVTWDAVKNADEVYGESVAYASNYLRHSADIVRGIPVPLAFAATKEGEVIISHSLDSLQADTSLWQEYDLFCMVSVIFE